jgi:thiol:disulfide interchange protein
MLVRDSFRRTLFVSVVACVWIAGCQDYKWQWTFQSPEDMQKLEDQARQEQKLVFIFYKWYLDSDANRMHGDVLADNKVGAMFSDSVNLLIDKAAGPDYERYLARFGVTAPPACIFVAPDGRYKVLTGYIAKDEFIERVQAVHTEFMGGQQRSSALKLFP